MKARAQILAVVLGIGVSAWTLTTLADGDKQSHSGDEMKSTSPAGEAAGHSHEMSELHGGQATMTKHNHFETVFGPDGIRIYRYSDKQVPMNVGKAAGSATLQFRDGSKKEVPLVPTTPKEGETIVYFCPGHSEATQMEPGVCEACGSMVLVQQDYLFGKVDLSELESGSVKAVMHIKGMPGPESEVIFTVQDPPSAVTESELRMRAPRWVRTKADS
jgi:hypothetical protein